MRGRSFFQEPACHYEKVLDFRVEQKDGAALCIMASRKTIKKRKHAVYVEIHDSISIIVCIREWEYV